MSYVELKHLLSELTLEAVQAPDDTRWPAIEAAYADLAGSQTAGAVEPPAGAGPPHPGTPLRSAERGTHAKRARTETASAAQVPHPAVDRTKCLTRAAHFAITAGLPPPSDGDVSYLIARGLFAEREDGSLALPPGLLPYLSYLVRHAPRLLNAVASLRTATSPASTSPRPPGAGHPVSASIPPAMRIGAALFNAGLFFECHEWFEGVWKATAGPEKELYHGIVQAAAAFYHYEKGNDHGSRTLIRKGQARLKPFSSPALGIDLARFKAALREWDRHFNGGPRPHAYPRIAPAAEGNSERGPGADGMPESDEIPEKGKGAPRG